jgi:nicotinamide mononucleotide transporter PnuC/nicotinamide mononucleotide transporter PnuC
MGIYHWISNNYIEIFGAVTGILYVFLEIKQNLWLWPVGIITSAVYIWVFLTGKLYADMSLQVYYLAISALGWFWWVRGAGRRAQGKEGATGNRQPATGMQTKEHSAPGNTSPLEAGQGDVSSDNSSATKLKVHRINLKTSITLAAILCVLYFVLWFILSHFTDSPVPACDSFITSLSIIATWMLARKIYEHWYLWIVVDAFASVLFFTRHLYPTVILYTVYCALSFAGLIEWRKSLTKQ